MTRIKNAKSFKSIVWLLLISLLGVPGWPLSSLAQFSTQKVHRVKPGDAIRIFVYDGPIQVEKNRFISQFHDLELVIDGYGEISLFSLGKVKVAGMTADEIRAILTEKFKPYAKDPNVIVIPLIRLILRGEFGAPGMYRFSLNTSFWDMIAEAGGIDNSYSLENMFIMRKNEILYQDFEEALHNASSLGEMGLESGDEIIAPRVNRLSFQTIMRYFQFGASIIILYLTILNRQATTR